MLPAGLKERLKEAWPLWRRKLAQKGLGLGLILVLVYFGYHSIHGQRGLFAWLDVNRELEARRAELAELEARRQRLERRVEALEGDGADPDLLEEELKKLGFVKEDEVVVLAPEP